ncbi:hypothetical protein Ddye_024623 [Dipteronia dyeriana]|uniref:Protein TIFY n=1 Tax=Dipteronia dyeriana TaxID=168575 RepID=A0AAD9TV60_9ROSI|nr:hypothetical protein Ddye_024623 [Dipteronia dyeriana]
MKRNCSLELRLLPPSNSLSSADFSTGHRHNRHNSTPQNQQKQLTIFYGGRVCVCDVTEYKARAILMIASREMEEKMRSPSSGSSSPLPLTMSPPVTPSIQSQLYSPVPPTGLSMKRSLQRFLQKRKHRAYPY